MSSLINIATNDESLCNHYDAIIMIIRFFYYSQMVNSSDVKLKEHCLKTYFEVNAAVSICYIQL